MLFKYKALLNNVIKQDELEAGSIEEVTEYLKGNGYFPIEIKEKKSNDLSFLNNLFDKVSFNDVTYMTRQFAIMLNAGLTLIDAIELILKQTNKVPLRKILKDIDKTLREGKTFSNCLAKYPKLFSNFYVALVRSGEASGKLDMILSKLAEHMEKQREFQQKIKNALIYPVVIISAMCIMVFVMFAFVMPRLLELYDSFQVDLPASTRVIMAISNFTSHNSIAIVIVVIAAIFGAKRAMATERGKRFTDVYFLKLPIFGNIMKTSALVDATRTLSILIGSGVPILDGLAIVVDVNNNIVFKEAFKKVKEKVEKGFGIGTAMANEAIFPPSLVQMTMVGEQTGHLDETLLRISTYYQSESESAVKALLTLIEPVILIVLGVGIGFLVFAVLSPIFKLTSSFNS